MAAAVRAYWYSQEVTQGPGGREGHGMEERASTCQLPRINEALIHLSYLRVVGAGIPMIRQKSLISTRLNRMPCLFSDVGLCPAAFSFAIVTSRDA